MDSSGSAVLTSSWDKAEVVVAAGRQGHSSEVVGAVEVKGRIAEVQLLQNCQPLWTLGAVPLSCSNVVTFPDYPALCSPGALVK